jgi:hypothetical protein
MILCQIENVSGEAVKNTALIAAGALACGYYIKEIFFSGTRPITPQPLEVREANRFASQAELDQLARALADARREQNTTDTEQRRQIYEKIDAVRQEMKQDLQAQTRNLEARLDGIPDRVIATLRNTGAI